MVRVVYAELEVHSTLPPTKNIKIAAFIQFQYGLQWQSGAGVLDFYGVRTMEESSLIFSSGTGILVGVIL